MKNVWISLICLITAAPIWAASNCVSRVDKNLNKSTTEKINYCLEEDKEIKEEEDSAGIIWSDTYTVQYPKAKDKNKSEEQQAPTTEIKTVDRPIISMEYLDRKTYPSFRNDTMPRLSPDEANEAAMEALQNNRPTTEKSDKKNKKNKGKKPQVKMNKPTKPIRHMSGETAPAVSNAAQVQQAQALQNDPLATNPTDNGATPNDFVDDSIMGPSGFGYNATDPVFQQ